VKKNTSRAHEGTLRVRLLKRIASSLATMACAAFSGQAAIAQSHDAVAAYPTHPIKLIVPHAPGGLVDQFSRALAQHLATKMGQPVVVENRPGANQAIGAESAARSAPDGYTLFLGTQTGLVFNQIVRKKLPYDPQRDFTPISMLFNTPFYLLVNPSVPAHSVQELIDLARAKPGALTYASLGQGSSQQLAAEMFKNRAKVDILHIPYGGTPQASVALLSGQVDMTFEGGGTSVLNVRSGKLRALAATGARRTDELPDVPTLSETIPGLEITVWFGLVAPAGTPQPIIARLNREVGEMLRLPSTKERFGPLGVEVSPSTPEELGARIRSDLPEWTKVMRDAGIQPE
jgi:tripartite-type tricarboxylate transporter receptor subunit TctC